MVMLMGNFVFLTHQEPAILQFTILKMAVGASLN